jgi:Fe-S cluster biogenesis protein NfuA
MSVVVAASETAQPVSRQRVEAVLDRLRPILQSDGGDIQLVDVHDRKARVRLLGRCAGCPSAHLTLYLGVETAIKDQIPEFDELLLV